MKAKFKYNKNKNNLHELKQQMLKMRHIKAKKS